MATCNKCNSRIANSNAKFCDNCGEFLELINKDIQFREKISNDKLKDLKNILLESIESMKKHNTDLRWYYELIMSYLIDVTNIEKIFRREEMNFIDIGCILASLENVDNRLILYEFLLKVNEQYEFQISSNKELMNVIIYTNTSNKLKEKEKFEDLIKPFNLEVFDFNDYKFGKEHEEKNNFNSRYLMFKFSKKTRDIDLLKSDALKEIYSFFGFLTYVNKFNKTTAKTHINELTLNNQISDLECNSLIVTDNQNKIMRFGVQNEIITNSKKINKSKIDKIPSNRLIKDFTKENKPKISNKIKENFYLYYLAANENILENSFFKFWSLSEKILKDIYGDMKDTALKKYMKNILKANGYPKYLIRRIDVLYIKRNEFVHENKHGEITQYDQTLVKVIAERLIDFLITCIDTVKNINEYGVILNYYNQSPEDKERLISLVKLTLPEK